MTWSGDGPCGAFPSPDGEPALQETEELDDQLDRVFGALANRTRRAILHNLSRGSQTVSELAKPHAISLAAISKHLDVLERAGLLRRERDGRIARCEMEGEPLIAAAELIAYYSRFWKHRLNALEAFVTDTPARQEPCQSQEEGDLPRRP